MNDATDEWALITVDQQVCWVESESTLTFRKRDLVLRPAEGDWWPDVSVRLFPGETSFEAGTILRRFLSVQAWRHRQPFREVNGLGGGRTRIRTGKRPPTTRRPFPGIDLSDLPITTTPNQDRALALHREALGLEPNLAYEFLGLFRILNVTLDPSGRQKKWINAHLNDIRSQALVAALRATHSDVGHYLYDAGRSALAHAFDPPLVDPDAIEDTYRITLDLPVVTELVYLYMEQELGIPPRR